MENKEKIWIGFLAIICMVVFIALGSYVTTHISPTEKLQIAAKKERLEQEEKQRIKEEKIAREREIQEKAAEEARIIHDKRAKEIAKQKRIEKEETDKENRLIREHKIRYKQNKYIVNLFSHKFKKGRSKNHRDQFRIIAEKGSFNQQTLEDVAISFARKYGSKFSHFMFFDNSSCLYGWDGTGLLKESDWPYWLCRISVDKDYIGKLYVRTFSLALDGETGLTRKGILKYNGTIANYKKKYIVLGKGPKYRKISEDGLKRLDKMFDDEIKEAIDEAQIK